MLVLNRKVNEKIIISLGKGKIAEITILPFDEEFRKTVRLGVDCPKGVQINREEIYKSKYGIDENY